ncbi:MAG: aldo/keto reductase [Planctomycetota bacterium]|nr:MAG: aldo/keto reductase [Planctomycetota bacterium]
MERRRLGKTDIEISPVALGCWPIAGMTSPGVTDESSLATLEACFELGINFLDTAYCYGAQGESERLIARALGSRRDEMVIATKGGLHWNADRKMVKDARPETLRRECEESLQRLGTDRVELLYLHAPDPEVAVAESAGELARLLAEGKTRSVGASNLDLAQLEEFASACPLSVFQPPYNMIQRDIETDIVPWCQRHQVSVVVYWPLMKGLLAGKLARDHQFADMDSRNKYSQFKGEEWEKNQQLVDELREIATGSGHTVAQLVVNWTIHQPGITAALCGAKRPEQTRDNAGAMGWQLSTEEQASIAAALARRGEPAEMKAV